MRALRHLLARRHRHQAARARFDMRDHAKERRERTRHLIELGGLVIKARIVEITQDDRATIYGALITIAERLSGDGRADMLVRWKRKGHRAFEAEAETKAAVHKSAKAVTPSIGDTASPFLPGLYDPPQQPKQVERSEQLAEAITPAQPDHAGPSSHADPPGIHDASGTSRTRPP